MSAAYCTLPEFRQRMSGDAPVMSGASDQTIVDIIAEVSALLDDEVRQVRGQAGGWSFLPPSAFGAQQVSISGAASGGMFNLTFGADTTVDIAPGASAATVQAALDTILGNGNSVVTGPPGGPWTVTFAGTLSGPQDVFLPSGYLTPVGTHAVVQEIQTGSVDTVVRRYTGALGGSGLLLIDDAVAVTQVRILDATGNPTQTLATGTDWLPDPLNGLPITGLTLVRPGRWPTYAGGIEVTLRPGYALTLPRDVRLAAVQESIRVYRGAQAGEDDRLGTTPWGTLVVGKALLQSTVRLVNRYRSGLGFLRRTG